MTQPIIRILLSPLWEHTHRLRQATCKVMGHTWMVRQNLGTRRILICKRCCKLAVMHHEFKALLSWEPWIDELERENYHTKFNWLEA